MIKKKEKKMGVSVSRGTLKQWTGISNASFARPTV
jgi:hypothetical protein